ncbi:MAG: response regulator transcription factor, partial [Planctomycetes bacterium]|nr:response regulator transcription factor [Planctomycetota bacterium]
MPPATILTIEDDDAIRRGIVDALEFEGYRLLEADRGDTGLERALGARYDLLLLDLVLPGLDGLEILRQVRDAHPTLPVIILSARGEERNRIEGLKLGADDYVVKPFSVRELAARVEAVLRRSPERPNHAPELAIPGGTADLARGELRFDDGRRIELSEREAEMLRYLAGHAGRTISRDELMSRVWRLNPRGLNTRAIDMQIARLREKLGDCAERPQIIRTVRGRGYVFEGAGGVQ